MTTTWREIRQAAQNAGLDVKAWEQGLHSRILHDLLVRTQTQHQYHFDAAFHLQMDQVLAFVLATVLEHDPLSEKLRERAMDLGAIFREEAFGTDQ
jgi:hypothetical protein